MHRGSPQLYDAGEIGWPTKVHVGCGNIYLYHYNNVDVTGVLASENLELMAANRTLVSDYYSNLEGSATNLPKRRPTVVDTLANALALPYSEGTVDKILAIQVFEHFLPIESWAALNHWHKILRPGGVLVMTVPDMVGTLNMIEFGDSNQRAFGLRHLRGSRRDQWNWHHMWYTPATLDSFLSGVGFDPRQIENPHFYPAIAIRAYKHG